MTEKAQERPCGNTGLLLLPDICPSEIAFDPLELLPGQLLYAREVHVGMVDCLQLVVGGLGLPKGVQPLVPEGGGYPGREADPGLEPLGAGGVHHGVQAHPAVGGAGIGHALPAGDEGQAQLRQQQVLDELRMLRVGTDHRPEAPGRGGGMEPLEHGGGQAVGILELVDFGAQSLNGVKPPDGALTGETAQKAEGVLAAASLSPQLPADDPVGTPQELPGVQSLPHQGGGAVRHLPRRAKGPVGPLVGGGYCVGIVKNVRTGSLEGGDVVELSQVDVAVGGGGVSGLHDVGRSNGRTLFRISM